jgi:hypothetical protein
LKNAKIESLYNSNFKQAGLLSFVMTPKKWIEATNAIGIIITSILSFWLVIE